MTQALVINSGSSSIKYGLFETRPGSGKLVELLCMGLVDKIGLDGNVIKHTAYVGGKTLQLNVKLPDHAAALKRVVELLTANGRDISCIKVVGHRVVHGGDKFSEPTIVDATVEAEIEKCSTLAPLHNPPNLLGIRAMKALFPSATQVAVFDTAFHATMPPESYRYALPKELYEKHGVRRYGFHGTSYKFVSWATAQALRQPLEDLNMIICHLGNGASMACLKKGKVVDTTMGLTPVEGLVMGTRSGDVDPGVYTHLCNHLGMSPKDVDTLLNKKSGLLGISGRSDMREVIQAAKDGDADAVLARRLYTERIRKYIGAYLVKLNGAVDALVFTAGLGEGDQEMREMVCDGLVQLGVDVDPAKNRAVAQGESAEVQSVLSRTKVIVMPTEEERSIAEQSLAICGLLPSSTGSTSGVAAPSASIVPADKDADVNPQQFLYNINSVARANRQHIVLPEGSDPRIIAAASECLERGFCDLTILGAPDAVAALAKTAGVSLSGAAIVDPSTAPIDEMVQALCKARASAGMTPEKATELIRGDATWFGTMMMYCGRIDGMVSGAIHSTAETMRPALQVIKPAPGNSVVSSVFFMLLPGGVKLFSDCAIVPDPTPDQMAEIAQQTARTARAFGLAPRIAFLSYATGDADKGPMIDKVRAAIKKAREVAPNEIMEGPIQYDAAVDPRVAAVKFKGKPNPVAGKASVMIFPDIDAGNITYKAAQQAAKCIAIGPIMQGLRMPVNDLSRGCTPEDVVAAVVVTCLQSIAVKQAPGSRL